MKKHFLPVIIGAFALLGIFFGAQKFHEKNIFLYAQTISSEPVWTSEDGKINIYKSENGNYIQREKISKDQIKESNIGIHCNIRGVQYIDHERYVVIDLVNIKVMKNNEVLKTSADTKIGEIEEIYFDDFDTLYFAALDKKYSLKIAQNNEPTLEEVDILPDFKPLRNSMFEIVEEIEGYGTAKKSLNRATGESIEVIEKHKIQKNAASIEYFKILQSKKPDWTDNLYAYDGRENIFMRAKEGSILYAFPNNISPIARLSETDSARALQIITPKSTLQLGVQTYPSGGKKFDFAYVLHPNYGAIYIENSDLNPLLTTKYDKIGAQELGFDAENALCMVRTLVNNVRIYRFPTAVYPQGTNPDHLVVKYLPRNYDITDQTHNTSLRVLREITIPDRIISARYYYEVRIDEDGVPNPVSGAFVGYIDTGFVIDSFRGLSEKRIVTNAKVVTDSSTNGVFVWDYNEKGVLVANEFEKLTSGSRVQVIGKLDGKYTHVRFDGFGEPREGYIETKYLVNDGINPWQIVALVALIGCIGIVSWIAVRQFSRKERAEDCAKKS